MILPQRISRRLRSSRGFTMIELLVVIAIIGVLAAAVLSAINPIEQINKGRDTRTRSDAAELVNAIERYYAVQEEFPWNSLNTGVWDPDIDGVGTDPDDQFYGAEGTNWAWMEILQSTDEVKEGFVDRVTSEVADDKYKIFKGQNAGSTFVCFIPESSQFKQEAANRCSNNPNTLPDIGVTEVCDDPVTQDTSWICVP